MKYAKKPVDPAEAKGRRDTDRGAATRAPAFRPLVVSLPGPEAPRAAPRWGETPRAPRCAVPVPREPRGHSAPSPEPLRSDLGGPLRVICIFPGTQGGL